MELGGLIISILAIGLSLYTYFKHDIKIKKQDKLLKDYQLEKIEKEKVEEKRATIEANVISESESKKTIKVYNKGKCVAREVIVNIPNSERYEILNYPFPIDIRPHNGINVKLVVFSGAPDKVDISFTWKDNYSDANSDSQTIQL